MKYVYPALFEKGGNGIIEVVFPDLEGCYTFGENLVDAMEMAKDVLALTLFDYENNKRVIPVPSNPRDLVTSGNGFVSYVYADTIDYQKRHNNKAVKKTLTIPEWLNEAATKSDINFSQVLQEALIKKLDLN